MAYLTYSITLKHRHAWVVCIRLYQLNGTHMYLRVSSRKDLLMLGKLLTTDANEDSFEWDYENVYEWMYVNVPGYDFSLNISREHGMADLRDEDLDKYENNDQELKKLLKPGPIYIFGWNKVENSYVNELPEPLILFIRDHLKLTVDVFNGRFYVDGPDPKPVNQYKI